MTFCKRGHIRIPENLYKNRWCRLCRKEWERSPDQKIKQIANQRKSQLKKLYGLTLEQYNQLFQDQNGKCAICQVHQTDVKRTFNVDHNHKTGKIRGLLCSLCNSGMGGLQDDIVLLEAAINYLRKTNG